MPITMVGRRSVMRELREEFSPVRKAEQPNADLQPLPRCERNHLRHLAHPAGRAVTSFFHNAVKHESSTLLATQEIVVPSPKVRVVPLFFPTNDHMPRLSETSGERRGSPLPTSQRLDERRDR